MPKRMPKPAALFLLAFWPLFAFAQEPVVVVEPEAGPLTRLFIQYVLPLLGTLLISALTWAGAAASRWLQTKTKNLQALALEDRMFSLARDAVAHVDAQIKAGLIVINEDGRVTTEEAKRLQSLALQALQQFAVARIAPETLKVIDFGSATIQSWLLGLIQKAFAVKPEKVLWSKTNQVPTVFAEVPLGISGK